MATRPSARARRRFRPDGQPLNGTMTTVETSANPSTFGDEVTFTAIVTPTADGPTDGSVTFTIDGTAQTPVPLQVVGGIDQAALPTSTLWGWQSERERDLQR